MDKREITENRFLVPVLIERRAVEGLAALDLVAGAPVVLLFHSSGEDLIDTASFIPCK